MESVTVCLAISCSHIRAARFSEIAAIVRALREREANQTAKASPSDVKHLSSPLP